MDRKSYTVGAEEIIKNQGLLEGMKSECESDSLSNVIAKYQRSLSTQIDARVILELCKWIVEKETNESEEVLTIIYRTLVGDSQIEISDKKTQTSIKHQLDNGNRFIKFNQCKITPDISEEIDEKCTCEEIWLNVDHIIKLKFLY